METQTAILVVGLGALIYKLFIEKKDWHTSLIGGIFITILGVSIFVLTASNNALDNGIGTITATIGLLFTLASFIRAPLFQ